MNNLQTFFEEYMAFCQYQKRLDQKTMNAYKTDLKQFSQQFHSISIEAVTSAGKLYILSPPEL